MLIYFVNLDPVQAARETPNGYVIKLQVEALQMLKAAQWHHSHGYQTKPPGYAHHPFTKWVSSSSWAWDWLVSYARALHLIEYPRRFADRLRKQGPPSVWLQISKLSKPVRFEYMTQAETPLCPLPQKAAVLYADNTNNHQQRAEEFRGYIATFKNKPMWQFLWESRPNALRPKWMPKRTAIQDDLVQRQRKRMKLI